MHHQSVTARKKSRTYTLLNIHDQRQQNSDELGSLMNMLSPIDLLIQANQIHWPISFNRQMPVDLTCWDFGNFKQNNQSPSNSKAKPIANLQTTHHHTLPGLTTLSHLCLNPKKTKTQDFSAVLGKSFHRRHCGG